MSELAYSLHLGSDKNKKNASRKQAKETASGTTSKSNNAIQNARQLSRVDRHNYRKYDNDQDDIQIIRGTTSLYEDVKNLYINEFEEARIKYNETQREIRKIDDYFTHISENAKNDLACEIIIELGDKKYWDTKNKEFKKRMTNVYSKQVDDLELMVPNFKICSAIIHYDETSPHMHIVGVPIKTKSKYGMEKQVGKSDVFTKESLTKLQDKMRILCIESFNREYNLDNSLKTKMKGRNIDINVKNMDNYSLMKEQLNRNQDKLEKANKKSLELNKSSNDIKDVISKLKTTITNKENVVLKKEDKDKLLNYIDKVDNTNSEYQHIQELSITLKDVDKELKDKKEEIKVLTENNEALSLRNDNLAISIRKKDNEIEFLKAENYDLKSRLNYWKNKFVKLIKFIKDKMFSSKECDKYYDVSVDLYEHGIIEDIAIREIKDNYEWNKEQDNRKSNNKDDFKL